MRVKKGTKVATGAAGWPGIEAIELSDIEGSSSQQHSSSSPKETWTGPMHSDTYGNPLFPGPYTAHSTIEPEHDDRRRARRAGVPPTSARGGVFRQDMICGMRRQMFWVIIATGTFAMIATVGIGVGLGVALRKADGPT
ncbi:hypothetical protein QBC33DRAFT_378612 [Phialemonium atrogriseum]|uniref:Uncharacterized protein n=1 Tax=Phialemonium atrogriseum TaxID=1093897 RepID=A0AAJ0C231_9PEZI|nr:uncharacterized protein QBC33DRAFT_378612 [Phialemonium atrogriseum]KAK1768466.1 hypothetical protein QBC33DRAFT_378612 [Phialemonium atrogriseum]